MNLFITETYITTELDEDGEETSRWSSGDSGPIPYETFTGSEDELFASLVREYGDCESSSYIDGADGDSIPVGWVFTRKLWGSNTDEDGEPVVDGGYVSEVHETWVSVYHEYALELPKGVVVFGRVFERATVKEVSNDEA